LNYFFDIEKKTLLLISGWSRGFIVSSDWLLLLMTQVNGKWEWEEPDTLLLPPATNSTIEFIPPEQTVKRKIRSVFPPLSRPVQTLHVPYHRLNMEVDLQSLFVLHVT
jgi:hypothetical protein